MKTKIIVKLGLLMGIAGLYSCEEWLTTPEGLDDSAGLSGYGIAFSKPLDLPDISNAYCGEATLFELWYDQPSWGVYGTVVVYHDGETLHVQYDILPDSVSAGWYIAETYLYVGGEWFWFNNTSPREPDWTTDQYNIIRRDVHEGTPSRIILGTSLNDLGQDCTYLAAKARIEHRDGDHKAYPRAYLNKTGTYLEKTWGDVLCIEPCDPE